jgi:hypothetical protein
MKSLKFILFFLLFFGLTANVISQKLFNPVYSFSSEKTAYITLNDGSQVEGLIQDIDRKKGLLLSFTIVDPEGKSSNFRAGDISKIYLAATGKNNMGKRYEFISDPAKWDNNELNRDLFKNGYAYFEQVEVEMGRKTRPMLLQLLNPSFSSRIKVYQDPFVSETTSLGTAELKRSGDHSNSYVVKDGNRPAFMLNKGSYQDNFIALFGECKAMVPLREKAKWSQFEQHLYDYNRCK